MGTQRSREGEREREREKTSPYATAPGGRNVTHVKPVHPTVPKGPRPALLMALSLLLVLLAYENALDVGFVWDDHVLIEQSGSIHSVAKPWRFFSQGFFADPLAFRAQGGFYRPLISLTLALDWWWGGGSPTAFHLSNLVLHLFVCAAVFFLARRLGATATGAAVSAALFGTTPRLTESVTWISGRTDVWATAFVLAALLLSTRKLPRSSTHLAVALLLTLGLFSKETALTGFVIIAIAQLRSRSAQSQKVEWLALLAGVLGYVAVRVGGGVPMSSVELHSPEVFLARLGHEVAMVATPWHPTPQRGFVLEPEGWAMGLGGVLLLSGGVGLWALWRRGPSLAFALGVGALFAAIFTAIVELRGIFPIMSDRYLYMPLALSAVLAARVSIPRWVLGPVTVLLGIFIVSTWRQNALWSNELRFWQVAAAEASPRNVGVLLSLGDALFEADRFEDAQRQYERALDSLSGSLAATTRLSIAAALSRRGRDDEALGLVERLKAEEPSWRRAWLDAALFNARALDFARARRELDELEMRLGADEASGELRRRIDLAAEVLSSPHAELFARAEALATLGATAHAQALFVELVASPVHQATATRWLVLHGEHRFALEGARGDSDPEAKQIYRQRWPELTSPE